MIGSLKNIRRTLAATLCLGVSIGVWGCTAEESPLSNCVPADTHCDGNTAVECVKYGGGKTPLPEHYKLESTTCPAPLSCFAGDGFAVCSLSAEPCDLATFENTCAGEHVVVCEYISHTSSESFQTVLDQCSFGNTCIVGDCAAPSDTTCDPMTHAPKCINGAPTICARMRNDISKDYREVFVSDACTDGNQCVTGPNWAGCGRDGTTCDRTSFTSRCEGDKLITCELAYGSLWTYPVDIEFQSTCPKGCTGSPGVPASCNP